MMIGEHSTQYTDEASHKYIYTHRKEEYGCHLYSTQYMYNLEKSMMGEKQTLYTYKVCRSTNQYRTH